jgi:hypothetical protein
MKTFKEFQNILEAYKDPDIKKIQNKLDKVVSTGKQTGFEYMKKGKPEQGQKIINRAVRRAHALSQVKKQFEKQPDLYALDRMAKIPAVDHKKNKVSEAYKEPDLGKMERQVDRHLKKVSAIHSRYSHSSNVPPSATDRMKKSAGRAEKIYRTAQDYKKKNPEVASLYKMAGATKYD